METLRDDSWCVLIRQAGVGLTAAIHCTDSPGGGAAPILTLSLARERSLYPFSSAQLVFASQNLHFEKKKNECDFDVY